jgi:peptidoglycan pentaglycine glycine transferase (the first glycine)
MDSSIWNPIITSFPDAHILQSWEWGQIKTHNGWTPIYKMWNDGGTAIAASLILIRKIPILGYKTQLSVMYLPKGPLLREWGNREAQIKIFNDLKNMAVKLGVIFMKIDPDVQIGEGIPGFSGEKKNSLGQSLMDTLTRQGWHFSDEQIQFRNTVQIDLTLSEEELLARMKQKTRYNIHLASRKGVSVRQGTLADLDNLYHMYAETSVRDGFVIRDASYYKRIWSSFMSTDSGNSNIPNAELLIAEVTGQPVAAVIFFRFAHKAWYLYGMSGRLHRECMPNYLLQWEAIRRGKSAGCTVYDLWGAPDNFNETDPLWNVFRFKEGLGGQVIRTMGAWDYPIRPVFYKLYAQILPKVLNIMRDRGKARLQQAI